MNDWMYGAAVSSYLTTALYLHNTFLFSNAV